jgi:hypothetical protein
MTQLNEPPKCEKCKELARENLGLLLMLREVHDVTPSALRATARSRAEDYLSDTPHPNRLAWRITGIRGETT